MCVRARVCVCVVVVLWLCLYVGFCVACAHRISGRNAPLLGRYKQDALRISQATGRTDTCKTSSVACLPCAPNRQYIRRLPISEPCETTRTTTELFLQYRYTGPASPKLP